MYVVLGGSCGVGVGRLNTEFQTAREFTKAFLVEYLDGDLEEIVL